MQLHRNYIAKQGYNFFSRATRIFNLVALLATNDLPWIFTPGLDFIFTLGFILFIEKWIILRVLRWCENHVFYYFLFIEPPVLLDL